MRIEEDFIPPTKDSHTANCHHTIIGEISGSTDPEIVVGPTVITPVMEREVGPEVGIVA